MKLIKDRSECIDYHAERVKKAYPAYFDTAFEAVKNIISGSQSRSNIWNVNTEKEYHEEKQN